MLDKRTLKLTTHDGCTLVGDIAGLRTGPGVVLLHGGGQTRHSWATAMLKLVNRGYLVANFDARGHGDSDWSPNGDYTTEVLASDLDLILSVVPRPTALVGASMGGLTAFHLVASSAGTIVDALVLVDIVLHPSAAGAEKIHAFMRANQDGFRCLAEAVAAVTAYNPHRSRPKNASGLMRNLRRRENGRLYWHWDPRMLNARPSAEPPYASEKLLELCGRVTLPTMVIRGGDSDVVDEAGIAEMRKCLPQTEVFEVPGAGHMVAGDKNDAFTAGMIQFLDRHMPPNIPWDR